MKKATVRRSILLFAISLLSLFTATVDASEFLNTIKKQHIEEIEAMITSQSSSDRQQLLESTFENGDTPLLFAAREGNVLLFDLLVRFGANPAVRDTNKRDIINVAIRNSDPEIVRRALLAGTDPKAFTLRYQGSTLIFASHQGEVEIAKMLIDAGAPLDRVNNLGWTALLEAVVLGDGGIAHQEIVKALLEAGADATIADNRGTTPLEHAKQKGYAELVTILLKNY